MQATGGEGLITGHVVNKSHYRLSIIQTKTHGTAQRRSTAPRRAVLTKAHACFFAHTWNRMIVNVVIIAFAAIEVKASAFGSTSIPCGRMRVRPSLGRAVLLV